MKYKAIWQPVQFTDEFLEWYGKRQAELHMKIQQIDDDMAIAEIEARHRQVYMPSLMPVLIILGSILGAVVGLLIVSKL